MPDQRCGLREVNDCTGSVKRGLSHANGQANGNEEDVKMRSSPTILSEDSFARGVQLRLLDVGSLRKVNLGIVLQHDVNDMAGDERDGAASRVLWLRLGRFVHQLERGHRRLRKEDGGMERYEGMADQRIIS